MESYNDAATSSAPRPVTRPPSRKQVPERLRASFGQMLRDARIAAGLSQRELSARTGIEQNYISKIENGTQNTTFDTASTLAHAVGLSLDFCGGPKPPPRPEKK